MDKYAPLIKKKAFTASDFIVRDKSSLGCKADYSPLVLEADQ